VRSYCTDPYSPYNKEEGTDFEADCGDEFQGCLECFLLHKGSYSSVHTVVVWHIFRGVVLQRKVVHQYGFGMGF
jgi:hypothetical protein